MSITSPPMFSNNQLPSFLHLNILKIHFPYHAKINNHETQATSYCDILNIISNSSWRLLHHNATLGIIMLKQPYMYNWRYKSDGLAYTHPLILASSFSRQSQPCFTNNCEPRIRFNHVPPKLNPWFTFYKMWAKVKS